jgi:hypothetical protein
MTVLEQRKLFKEENEIRRAEALRHQRNLKVHRLVVEHKSSGERRTIYLMGRDMESDIKSWRVEANLQHGVKMKDWSLVEQTGAHCPVQFISPKVKGELCMEWVQFLNSEQKQKVLEYIKKG